MLTTTFPHMNAYPDRCLTFHTFAFLDASLTDTSHNWDKNLIQCQNDLCLWDTKVTIKGMGFGTQKITSLLYLQMWHLRKQYFLFVPNLPIYPSLPPHSFTPQITPSYLYHIVIMKMHCHSCTTNTTTGCAATAAVTWSAAPPTISTITSPIFTWAIHLSNQGY